MLLFIDDTRPYEQADPAIVVRNYEMAVRLLSDCPDLIDTISFDHDLGMAKSGYEIASWIERMTFTGQLAKQFKWKIHSANPIGRKNIKSCMASIDKFWEDQN